MYTLRLLAAAGRRCGISITLATAILLLGCSSEAPEKRKLVVGYLPIIADLPTIVAREQGFFGDSPIEFRIFGTSNDLLSALANNEVDIATTLAVAPLAAREWSLLNQEKRSQVRIFSYSRTTVDGPFDAVFADPEGTFTTLGDIQSELTRVRIGVFPGTTAKNMFNFYLRREYGEGIAAQLEWVPLPPNLQLDALRQGDIDLLYTYEPTATLARQLGMLELHGSVIASVLPDAPYGCSAINRLFERQNPDLAARFIAGFDRALRFVRNSPDVSRKLLVQHLNLPPELAAACNIEERLTSDEIMAVDNRKVLDRFLELLAEIGETPSPLHAERLLQKED